MALTWPKCSKSFRASARSTATSGRARGCKAASGCFRPVRPRRAVTGPRPGSITWPPGATTALALGRPKTHPRKSGPMGARPSPSGPTPDWPSHKSRCCASPSRAKRSSATRSARPAWRARQAHRTAAAGQRRARHAGAYRGSVRRAQDRLHTQGSLGQSDGLAYRPRPAMVGCAHLRDGDHALVCAHAQVSEQARASSAWAQERPAARLTCWRRSHWAWSFGYAAW